MTAFAYYYLSLFMVMLAVISNRYWRRQIRKADEQYEETKKSGDRTAKEVASVAAECTGVTGDLSALTKRAERAEAEYQAALGDYERRKNAPTERYFVFERSVQRPGAYWEVAVRRLNPDEPSPDRPTWAGVRSYMMIADSEGAALRRAQARFTIQNGYQVVQAIPSRVAGLSISRVDEFSTYRRPTKEQAEAS